MHAIHYFRFTLSYAEIICSAYEKWSNQIQRQRNLNWIALKAIKI